MPSKIEWCDHTWNPWWGCDKIAPECGLDPGNLEGGGCYAAVFASRGLHSVHASVAVKGEWTGLITRSSLSVWQAPLKWRPGARVFTCSM
jgi:protein gp37